MDADPIDPIALLAWYESTEHAPAAVAPKTERSDEQTARLAALRGGTWRGRLTTRFF